MCYVFEKQYMIGKVLGKNTRVSGHSLLQGIFLTQESKLGLPHSRQILYHLPGPELPGLCPAVVSRLLPFPGKTCKSEPSTPGLLSQ